MLRRWLSLTLGSGLVAVAATKIILETLPDAAWGRAPTVCRWFLCDETLLLGNARRQLWSAADKQGDATLAAFSEALRRNPGSAYRWCDLGQAFLLAGRVDQARYCYHRAVERGLHAPPVLLRAVNFHYAIGEEETALRLSARILRIVADFDQVLFESYTRMGVDIQQVLRLGLPKKLRPAHSYFDYLLRLASQPELEAVWKWLLAHRLADKQVLSRYVDLLLETRNEEAAARVLASYAGQPMPSAGKTNRVFNGGFEFEPTGVALDWRILPSEHAIVKRDANTAHRGSWSLRIDFDGAHNLHYHHVSQKVVVQRGTLRFQARLRTHGITTEQGFGFRIYDPERPDRLKVDTQRLKGKSGWQNLVETFRVPPETNLVEVQLIRARSRKFDNKLAGTVWIDEVSLVRP